jgi:hypothetical protein
MEAEVLLLVLASLESFVDITLNLALYDFVASFNSSDGGILSLNLHVPPSTSRSHALVH